MTSASPSVRSLAVYGVCLPLAVLLGFLLASPFEIQTVTVLGLVLLMLVIPLLLRWYHTWLIAVWNSSLVLFFLPGPPAMWTVLAWGGFLIAGLQYILDRRQKFLSPPSLTRPLLFLALVVILTASANGGMGMRVFGGDTFGGKRYLMILSAIAGYLALTSQRIPPGRARFAVMLFFLGTVTMAMGELSSLFDSAFKPIALLFPQNRVDALATPQAALGVQRHIFLAPAGLGLVNILLARYGIRGIFAWGHPFRLASFLGCVLVTLFGGYRSGMILILLTFSILFYLEGLMRSPLLPILVLSAVLIAAVLTPFTTLLPFSVQRSLAFLPITVDPAVKISADDSTVWRVNMWRNVLPQVPEHLLLGKGYTFSMNEMRAAVTDPRVTTATTGFEMATEFHNGPLSLIIPFGVWGVIAFTWFLAAGWRVLHRNYMYGDPALRELNALLLAYFGARALAFWVVVGGFYSDFYLFTGVVGLSVSLNAGGLGKRSEPEPDVEPLNLLPSEVGYQQRGFD